MEVWGVISLDIPRLALPFRTEEDISPRALSGVVFYSRWVAHSSSPALSAQCDCLTFQSVTWLFLL